MRLSQHWRLVLYDHALRANFGDIRLKHDAVSRATHNCDLRASCFVSPSTSTILTACMYAITSNR